jgi:hypothetical protein
MASEQTLSAHAGSTARAAEMILMSIVLWSLTAGHIFGDSPKNPTGAKFRRPRTTSRPALPSLASRKNRVLWAFFAILTGPVNRLALSVALIWLPGCVFVHHPLVNGLA